ncbi:MAG TPA: hypothetical protein VLA56_21215 [Pseudomonadales bacterium]|nr:hypothetical protein [Pseudomonadales bacterium]
MSDPKRPPLGKPNGARAKALAKLRGRCHEMSAREAAAMLNLARGTVMGYARTLGEEFQPDFVVPGTIPNRSTDAARTGMRLNTYAGDEVRWRQGLDEIRRPWRLPARGSARRASQ